MTNLSVAAANLTGTVSNGQLANNSIAIAAGTGLSGGGIVTLGGATTLNNTGVLSVTGNADITVSTTGGAVALGDTATNAAKANSVVKRDANGSFSATNITLSGNLNLPDTTTNGGIIYSGTNPILHAYGAANLFVGLGAGNFMMSGSANTAVGYQAGYNIATGSNNICIGNPGDAADTNVIRIGTNQTQTFIAGISGVTAASGVAVYVNPSGQLGTLTSSARFKRDIRRMDDASEALYALRPVTFHYKPELDPQAIPQFGLVAEEVEEVDPKLVARDDQDRPYTVRYEAVNAMLLNEFLKEHRKVEAQHIEIEELKARLEKLEQSLDAKNVARK